MLPWPARSPDITPIELEWVIIGWQRQCHPQPELNNLILTDQEQHTSNFIPQTDIRNLYDTLCLSLHACI
ncbi:uncharacterized protein TNCV_3222001 [Trichonephila clavipes]|nr:uncharacterized protein TNCV_3222001 [Trichonephila clavipes]